jgi:hypothetical protein
MTARDRFTEHLKCPVCGRNGVARLSEADGWEFERDQSRRVDECPDGFRYEKHPTNQNLVVFMCIKDGVRVDQ